MCTATWLIRPDGYDLFFNRDEKNERSIAEGPRILDVRGRRAIAPRDTDAGGTWIGVNELGLGLGLLNAWEFPDRVTGTPRSRGLLVHDLLDAEGSREVARRLDSLDLGVYRGFHLAVFAPGEEPRLYSWDGRELTSRPPEAPLSSSSYDSDAARRERAAELDRLRRRHARLVPDVLAAFQASHVPARGPLSVCMHRADAATVSSARIHVEREEVRFAYAPGPPCATPFDAPLHLSRPAAPLASLKGGMRPGAGMTGP